jgi:adenylylsulfate kinase
MKNYKNKVIWFTGLSGSGKTTLSILLRKKLTADGLSAVILDGDDLRLGINADLGFEETDRIESNRRVAEIANIFKKNNTLVIVATISPTEKIREMAKKIIGEEDFLLIFFNSSLEICENRDVKGFYKEARTGEIKNFTGVTSRYEIPHNAFTLNTENDSIEKSAKQLYNFVISKL